MQLGVKWVLKIEGWETLDKESRLTVLEKIIDDLNNVEIGKNNLKGYMSIEVEEDK